ncbi:ranBP-type and C3HC4-type zinc finger-containing protein 1-like isoform X2 [Ptychodera flava]|uniref:ranBP-type and C3HC4-type zinc finger-containing protein 1-like isoform X2 n=1 Tax=Ptychodera flava TaxID=63121 RepID=UPI00396A4039
MAAGTMLLSKEAQLLRFEPSNYDYPWCSIVDPNDREGTPAIVQIFEQPHGRFHITSKHRGSQAPLLGFNLNEVDYVIKNTEWHEVTMQRNQKYAIVFHGKAEGQGFATVVQNSLHEIKRAGTGNMPQGARIRSATLGPRLPSAKSPSVNVARIPNVPLLEQLNQAIARGDVDAAQALAVMLAKEKEQTRWDQGPQTINIRIHIEDRLTSGGRIPLKVKPTLTIAELKREISDKYSFPEQVQNWIVGKRLAKDHDNLAGLGVRSGSSVYLYLKSAQSVGLTKEQYENQKLAMLYPNQGDGAANLASPLNGQLGAEGGARRGQTTPGAHTPDVIFNTIQNTRPENQQRGNQMAATHIGAVRDHDDYHGPTSITRRPTEPPPPPPTQRQRSREVGWECPTCTFLNEPTRPGCEMCSTTKPDDFVLPDDYVPTDREKERLEQEARNRELLQQAQERDEQMRLQQRQANFANLIAAAEENDLIANLEEFDCLICFLTIERGEGVILRDCLHSFCRDCLRDHITHNEEAVVMCPFQDDVYSCHSAMTEREIKALVSAEQFQKYLQRGLHTAENMAADSYHCKTPDCQGWCYYDDNNNFFQCPVCHKKNCLTCKAIHEGLNCKQYQDDLRRRAENDTAAKQTKEMLEQLVADGEAMHCPRCNIILQKKEGCDWLRCTMCKLEICWVTKGPRWGEGGQGDVSGGCRCRVGGRKCHPNCRNCH